MRSTRKRLKPHVLRTLSMIWPGSTVKRILGKSSSLHLKLELMQVTGTFKARGAMNTLLQAGDVQKVTAVSAGNHAIASAYAARQLGADAKVVMLASANPARVEAAEAYGAEVLIAETGAEGFALVNRLVEEEGRLFIHPFEGPSVTLATAGVGLELLEDCPELEAVIIAVGGGGLASGVAAAVKAVSPACKVYGVEPEGADVMRRSFDAGSPQTMASVSTIADSLAPPMTTPYAFAACRENFDDLVTVSDADMQAAMALLFEECKLVTEPAAAAATAGAFGALREKLEGKRVGVIVCGANIDRESFCRHIDAGQKHLAHGLF